MTARRFPPPWTIVEDAMEDEKRRFWAELDKLDPGQVRMNFATDVYLGPRRRLAAAWIERHNAEQLKIVGEARDAALAAARAAHTANTKATIALIIAALAAFATIIGAGVAIIGPHSWLD